MDEQTSGLKLSRKYKGRIRKVLRECLKVLEPREELDIIEYGDKRMRDWNADLAHALHEPARATCSRKYREVVYVGPSRTSKSKTLVDLFTAYHIDIDPIDLALFFPVQDIASYFSKKRFSIEMMANVEGLSDKLRQGVASNNIYQKIFKTGTILNFGWTSKSQAASRDFVAVVFSDMDRASGDIGGEGSFFELLANRTETYLSRGMAVAESSPGKPIIDPEWTQETPHDAPPTTGILSLYEGGTKKVLYAKCHHCDEYFAPIADPSAMHIPAEGTNLERARAASLICTTCGGLIDQDHEKQFRSSANTEWVAAGQTINSEGVISGEMLDTPRDSYWQVGWFAAFRTWERQISKYLDALDMFNNTGDEGPLKTIYNTGLAAPYLEASRRVNGDIVEQLISRAEPYQKYFVPEGCRTIIAGVDVQGGEKPYFVVQIIGYGIKGERWLLDRFNIRKTADGKQLHPGANAEHWDVLTDQVVNRTFNIDGDKELRVWMTAVDSGGEAGVTEKAYEWWRTLKKNGMGQRVRLVKGGSTIHSPRVKLSYPDSTNRKDRFSGGRGDVPLLIINPVLIKDSVYNTITNEEEGINYFHFPDWDHIGAWWYKELTAETRTPKGWSKTRDRNEAFDLCVYPHALWVYYKFDKINWEKPPIYAQPMNTNSEVMLSEDRRVMKNKPVRRTVRRRKVRYQSS